MRTRRRALVALDLLVVGALAAAVWSGVVLLDGGELPATSASAFPTSTVPVTTVPPPPPTTAVVAATTPTTAAPPTTAPPPLFRAPLTGSAVDEATAARLGSRRVLAVKIDDAPAVAVHPGLDRADVVVEMLVEGGLTRYMALFQSEVPATVGPVRSVRTSDFSLIGALGVPILAYSGGNPRTLADAQRLPAIVFPPDRADRGVYRRDSAIEAPHNLFLSPQAAWDRVIGAAAPVSPFANPRGEVALPGGVPAGGVEIRFSGVTDSTFGWDGVRNRWVRSQRGTVQRDGEGNPLGVDVVISLEVPYGVSPYDPRSPEARPIGFGTGTLLAGGSAVPISWSRPDGLSPFTLFDAAGTPIVLPSGRSWLALVPAGAGRTTLRG